MVYDSGSFYGITCSNAVGVKTVNQPLEINIYPNPNSGLFTLDFVDEISNSKANLQISNMLGVAVVEKSITSGTQIIDIQNLPNGIYIVKLVSNQKTFTQKIVKQ